MDIELKYIEARDKQALITLCNAVDRKYLTGGLPFPYTESDADWWIQMTAEEDGKNGIFRGIYADGTLVGNISVERKSGIRGHDAEIGYILRTEYWGRGIMSKAAREICRLAFEELDILRITGLCFAPNFASIRVLEKAGFQQEGILRKAIAKPDGAVYDLVIMGLLKEREKTNEL